MSLASSRGSFGLLGGRCIHSNHPQNSAPLPDSSNAPAVVVGLVTDKGSMNPMSGPRSPAPSSSCPPSVNAEEVIVIEDGGEDWPPIEWDATGGEAGVLESSVSGSQHSALSSFRRALNSLFTEPPSEDSTDMADVVPSAALTDNVPRPDEFSPVEAANVDVCGRSPAMFADLDVKSAIGSVVLDMFSDLDQYPLPYLDDLLLAATSADAGVLDARDGAIVPAKPAGMLLAPARVATVGPARP